MRDRLATELAEEREARLQQMRDRLATDSVEEKEARLQQMSTRQCERLATESAEDREARLYHTDSMPIVDMSSNTYSCTITADLLNWHLSFGLLRLAPQCLHFN